MDKGIGVPSDEKIVNMIQAWRLKEKEEKGSDNGDEDSEDGLGLSCLEKSASEPLKRDNVAPDEVVEIIKELRGEEKRRFPYTPYQASDNDDFNSVKYKMEEIELIFKQISNGMEWEKINVEALQSIKNEHGLTTPGEVKTWVLKTNNFLRLGQKIISIAEQSKIMSEYMTMNEEFRKCLKDENRRTDEKETGEKRPVPETPSPTSSRRG